MWNARLDEAQAGIKVAERNINNLRYADDTVLMAECKEELKSVLMKLTEKAMALHPSTLAWKIPWMEEPGRLRSMGSLRVGHDWALHFHFDEIEREEWKKLA